MQWLLLRARDLKPLAASTLAKSMGRWMGRAREKGGSCHCGIAQAIARCCIDPLTPSRRVLRPGCLVISRGTLICCARTDAGTLSKKRAPFRKAATPSRIAWLVRVASYATDNARAYAFFRDEIEKAVVSLVREPYLPSALPSWGLECRLCLRFTNASPRPTAELTG